MIPASSAGTRHLSQVIEGSVAEESMVNCFEMVTTDSEQILNLAVNSKESLSPPD